jgi:PAS domain S-box-containing protein
MAETDDRFAARWRPDRQVRVLLAGTSSDLVAGATVLSEAGYDVRMEPTAEGALEVLDHSPFDLVVVDRRPPDSEGIELCTAIRTRTTNAQVHVIVLTSGGTDEPARALEAGVDDYLITPFESVELLARVHSGARSVGLHTSEARLRTLMANVPGAIYRCANDRDWTMELISDDIERISGYPSSDFIGSAVRTFASIIHPEDRGQVEREVAEATQAHRMFILEYRIVRADSTLAWVLERGQQVSSTGRSWLDGVIFDITERRQAEDQLHESLRRLAVVEDRERIARDLHDGVIQSLFGVGMKLQAASQKADQANAVRASLAASVDDIQSVIEDLRHYVFGLRPGLLADRELHQALDRLAADFQLHSQVVTVVDVDASVAAALTRSAGDVLQLTREALSNVRRHAQATTCRISLARVEDGAVLEIDDDGCGFDPVTVSGYGQGRRNLSERAVRLGGRLELSSGTTGTTVTVHLPLRAPLGTTEPETSDVGRLGVPDVIRGSLGPADHLELAEDARDVVADRLLGQM